MADAPVSTDTASGDTASASEDVVDPAPKRSSDEQNRLAALAARTVRGLTIDAVEAADSGHPGLPMGMAEAAVTLWTRLLVHDPKDPAWPNRDRFVLSAGHGSMLLYSLLHLSGYDLPKAEIERFRQLHSITPGHPENHITPGVETTTGPLGQGLANAVGMALAEAHLAAEFNTEVHTIVDHYTYVVASDGDLMEGVTNEACSLAGHLGLSKLIVLYDDNEVTIDGGTSLAFTEDVGGRYEALGWQVVGPVDGHDPEAVAGALQEARHETERPSLIMTKTIIGKGAPAEGTSSIHSDALGAEDLAAAKETLGIPEDPTFFVPEEASTLLREQAFRGMQAHCEWEGTMSAYREAYPEKAAEFERRIAGRLPDGWDDDLPAFEPGETGMATRAASGSVLEVLTARLPELIGGSADLTPSNKTKADLEDLTDEAPSGRYVRFGVREHAMGAILNGMALHGGVRPYGGTFLVFSDYMRPPIRLAALSEINPLFVFTHDSIGLGEDGPTHQPVEQLAGLRAIPDLPVIRPADANEVVAAWRVALMQTDRPVAFAFTRQGVPTLEGTQEAAREGVARGAYVLRDCEGAPDVILIASGSEVSLALRAVPILESEKIDVRVVSMPCDRLFLEQDEAYREEVLPSAVRARVAVEAGSPLGWHRFVGVDGAVVGLDRFGESAPWTDVYPALGFTPENVAEAARAVIARQAV